LKEDTNQKHHNKKFCWLL